MQGLLLRQDQGWLPREMPKPSKKPMKEEAISAGIDRMVVMPITSRARGLAVKPQIQNLRKSNMAEQLEVDVFWSFAVPGPILRRRACANGKSASCLR